MIKIDNVYEEKLLNFATDIKSIFLYPYSIFKIFFEICR